MTRVQRLLLPTRIITAMKTCTNHYNWCVKDFQHKLTAWLVTEYDFVAIADLDPKPMLGTSQNVNNKQDAAWS
jgi:transposase